MASLTSYTTPGRGKVKTPFWESTSATALLASITDSEARAHARHADTVFHVTHALFGAPVHTGEAVALRDVCGVRAIVPGDTGDLDTTTFYVPMAQFDMRPHFPH